MPKYHSGYLVKLGSKKFGPNEYSNQVIEDEKLKLFPSNYKANNWEVEWVYNDRWNGLEFIILADTFDVAQSALHNILCSAAVIEGTLIWSNEAHYPHELGSITDKVQDIDVANTPIRALSNDSIPGYFRLGVEASKDEKLENAVIKYQLSTEIYSQHFMDLHEVINWKTTNFRFIQMKFAYAIIIAYSIIEELGLAVNVNVSLNRRSTLENGEWNKEVFDDLTRRLTAAGIDVNDEISWMIRGQETTIEKKRPVKLTRIAKWADKEDVGFHDPYSLKINDGYLMIQNAINHISFLRSSISSHAVGSRIMDLSVFDVSNAQNLARRLLLEKTGNWK